MVVLVRSSRDAFLAALYKERPAAVVGESAFLRAALTDAKIWALLKICLKE